MRLKAMSIAVCNVCSLVSVFMASSSTPSVPTEENHFKAYYTPWLGGVLLALGLLNLFLALWLMLVSGGFSSTIITGLVVTVVGFLYLTRPCFAIAPNRLTLYNLLGSSMKRYSFTELSDIQIDGKQVYIRVPYSEGGNVPGEKVRLNKWMIKPSDWKKFQHLVSR